jgi:hypothetical protein
MMDKLHTVIQSISGETKAKPAHLTVFREFLAHLDSIQHKAPVKRPAKPARAKPVKRKPPKRAK